MLLVIYKGRCGYSNAKHASSNEVEYHMDICCATKGAHIEIYWESYALKKK
jgi:nitrite reductase/ring-hydroxylating ferredoxin subunit